MSAVALQRVVVRMLFDAVFRNRVYANPESTLHDVGLTLTERQWLLTPDPRAYGVDTHRASRALTSLLEEYPVAGALVLRTQRGLENLQLFFTSELFHHCIQWRGSMAEAFGRYLGSALFAWQPNIGLMAKVELAIAQVRRASQVTYDPARVVAEDDQVRLPPWVRLLLLHPRIVTCYTDWLAHLDRRDTPRLETVLDTTYRLPPSVLLPETDLEWVLVVGVPDDESVSLEPASSAIGDLLSAAQTNLTCRALAEIAIELGAETDEGMEIIQNFLDDRLLIKVTDNDPVLSI